ncbi:hypothetical protein IV203_005585 [Nitzschia inconspicua]|uniref:Uncharacterized protein n=1 Tax=Nitzschia inconspicua TaxID=303405 RepID=A0A9K3KML7_9STRA|nr:hypothetical protein IV203_005579 [Nitzschia inconspicua]KAG7346517.1 hypothetical protein IV203_005585 [Nitzschia inconspicua]
MSSSSSASSRGSTPPPHNLLPAPTIDDGSGPVSAERFLAIHSNKLSVLFAICIGLEETIEDKTVPLMDLNEDSFKLIKKKKDIKPSLEILREEVKRRSESNKQDGNKPKPNGWSAKKHQFLEITWSAEENSERRKCELKKSSEQSVIVDTETRSGTKTADSSIGGDGGRQPPKTETDVRNEARRVACIKRKRNQEIQAEKMVRLRNETLQHVTPGTVVSMKMDPRDVKRARGLLGIVCDRSGNRAGGVQVATEEGKVTADLKKREYFIPSDRYALQKVQDLALPDKLEVVRQEIMNGLFDLGNQKQKVSMKTAYRLVEGGPPIERKGCG